ncbi:MAG: histidine phosphatase family protein [Oscillospiraceae bacterium]|nr:histidine phosphatase family protein [Oscillospiraceae bacterium]
MRILLIRHGMTLLGEQKRYQGSTDTPLSESGRDALRRVDDADHVYHSPLLRASETAQILFPHAGKSAVSDLREMHFGVFEGRGWWEMEQDPDYRHWVEGGCLGQCPGGEDKAAFSARTCAAFERIVLQAQARQQQKIAVVAHGGTQMAVLERWGEPKQAYFRWQTPCGAGYELDDRDWPHRLEIIREVCYTE